MTSYEEVVMIFRVPQNQAKIVTDFYYKKNSEYLNFGTGRCSIVFGENHNSLSFQNGGQKFVRFAYFYKISHFCFYLKTKYIFVASMTVVFQKNIKL